MNRGRMLRVVWDLGGVVGWGQGWRGRSGVGESFAKVCQPIWTLENE